MTRGLMRATGQFNKENSMNKDQVKGRIAEAEGKVKEVTGKAFSKDLEIKGKVQKSLGQVQASYGDLKEDAKKAVKSE